MTVQGVYNAGDIVTVVECDGYDVYPGGCLRVLKDFDDNLLRQEFEARYTGRPWEFPDHYFNFLLKRGYVEVFPTQGVMYL